MDAFVHFDKKEQRPDEVNAPEHYCFGGIETIDYLKAKMSPEEFKGFLKGNTLKYLSRAAHKGKEAQDYAKAKWYLDRLNREMEAKDE